MKARFIINPRSGGSAGAFARVQAFARAQGAEVAVTTHPRHATELAARALAEGCDLVVAVGGDGTLNEVASCLVNTSATFGLVPCGSGNGLGRHLGIHGSVEHSLEVLRTGRARLIDTGFADGHPFFTVAGLGFEAEVSARFNQLARRGFLPYLTTAARLWRRHVPELYDIETSGQRITVPAFTLAVANSDQYGNGARIAPGARVDDGLLDLTTVPPVTAWSGVPLLTRLFTGSLAGAREVRRFQAPRFVVERAGPGLMHTDGEVHSVGARVEFTVQPGSLRVLAPAMVKGR